MRFRRRHSTKKNLKISIIIIALVLIGVGYAYINSTLGISGATTITSNSWDVHFANVRMENHSFDSTNDSVTIDENDPTSLDLDLSLETIDDYILVYVDIVNDGGIDAVLKSISNDVLTEEQKEYLDFYMFINELEDFTENNYYLKAGNTDSLTIKFNYNESYEAEEAIENSPDENNIDETINLTFGQATRRDTNENNKSTLYSLVFKNAQNDSSLDFSQPSSSTNGNGLFVVNGTENDYNPIYYFRGNVENNYVAMDYSNEAKECFRILRTTNTGAIKIISIGTVAEENNVIDCSNLTTNFNNSQFNNFDDDNAAAGLFYGAKGASTYESAHENINESVISFLGIRRDYQFSYEEEWCNDRSGLSYGTNEATSNAYNRIVNNTGLSLYCSQPNDAFKINIYNTYGNNIRFITADEAIYAGAGYTTNNTTESNSFIKTGVDYWTITPSRFTGGKMKMFYVSSKGMIKEVNTTENLSMVNIIALKRGVRPTKGNGTATNPYYIKSKRPINN